MQTDKDLIRAGRYQEALVDNFDCKPYYIIPFPNGFAEEPGNEIEETFETKEEAHAKCIELEIVNFIIGNSNHDWL